MRKNTFLFIALGLFLAVYTASAQQTFTVKGQLDVSLSGYEIECFFVDVYDSKLNPLIPSSLYPKDYSFQFEVAPGDYYLRFWINLHANNISVSLTYYLDGETKRLKSLSEVQSTDLTPLSVSGNIDLGTLRRDASNDVVNISGSIKMPFDINLEGPGDSYQLEIEMRKYNTFPLFSSSSSFYLEYLEEVAKGEILKFSGLIEKGVYDTGTFLISKGCGKGTTYNGIRYQLYLKHTEDGWQTSTQPIESEIDLTHDVSNIDIINPPGVHTVSGKLINASGIIPCIDSGGASSDYINNDTKTFNFTLADSEIHLAPGSAVQGIIRSPEGATINIPEGVIVPIEGKAVVIRFTNPTIPGFSSFAQLTIPALPEGYTLVEALTICPEGYKLSTPATITIPYDKTKIPSGFTKDDLLVLAVDPEKGDWVSVEVKEVTEDTVTIETDILSTYAVVVPVAIGYPILDLHILDLIEPTNTENVYHFTENIFDPYGTAHIHVNTIKTGTEAVDIYAKCTYPDGRSYWLYFDTEIDTCEEWGW